MDRPAKHEAPLEIRPHPSLTRYIDSYWSIRGAGTSAGPEVMYPVGYPLLEFNLGDAWRWHDADAREHLVRSSLMSITSRPFQVAPTGTVRAVVVRLHPYSLRRLTGESPRADQVLDPALVLGPRFREVEEQLAETADAATMKAHLDAFFRGVFDTSRHQVDERVRRITGRILAERGSTRLEDAAADVELGLARVEQLFRAHLGMPPKTWAGIVRFQGALSRYRPGLAMAELALDAGYYDQAHFSRHFKRLTGRTPRAFFTERPAEAYRVSGLYNTAR